MTTKFCLLFFLFFLSEFVEGSFFVEPGPLVKATVGEVWPKPRMQQKSQNFLSIDQKHFKFQVTAEDCDILQNALERYYKIVVNKERISRSTIHGGKILDNEKYTGILTRLDISLQKKCTSKFPKFGMNESYVLSIVGTQNSSSISSESVWGILRGLETFSQLLYVSKSGSNILINETVIEDYPRFSHRGLLIDTSRHYLPIKTIKQILRGMEYNKLNVLHWHITDDQSFPYQSKTFPELSDKGAYHPQLLIYTRNDIQRIMAYAAGRGIRVIPEFDSPGHTRSWGEGRPDLLTSCSNFPNKISLGPINPIYEFVYSFMEMLLREIKQLFHDEYLHLGGDEVAFDCWKNNTDITEFMNRMNITDNYSALQSYYMHRIINISNKLGVTPIVWQEVFDNDDNLPHSAVVQIWKDPWEEFMQEVTSQNYSVLLSTCWYLDHLFTGGDWTRFYNCEPTNFLGTPFQKSLILGGEACMWGEVVNEYNVIPRIFPRASAVAEVLWSDKKAKSLYSASRRLEEHTCRMNKRGIPAQPPNGPGFCL